MSKTDQSSSEVGMLFALNEQNCQSTTDLESPKQSNLERFVDKNKVEIAFLGWNGIWSYLELFRDSYFTVPVAAGGNVEFVSRTLEHSSGVLGFLNEHIGSSLETLEVFYGTRIAMGLSAMALEKIAKIKISPTVQVALSMLIATIGISGVEAGAFSQLTDNLNAVSDKLDIFGPLFMAAWAGGGYKAIKFLFDEGGSEKVKNFMENGLDQTIEKVAELRVVGAEIKNQISNGIEQMREKNQFVGNFMENMEIMFPTFFPEKEVTTDQESTE